MNHSSIFTTPYFAIFPNPRVAILYLFNQRLELINYIYDLVFVIVLWIAYDDGGMIYMQNLTGKTALITGAGKGIGRATAIAFAKDDKLTIYINKTDAHLKEDLEAATHVELMISNIDFFGGIRSVIPDRNILIDNSFMSKLREEKMNFKLS